MEQHQANLDRQLPWSYRNETITTTTIATIDSTIGAATPPADLHLPLVYTILEVCVAISAVFGNLLVIVVFLQDRRLRKVTNFYIISLSVADLLVGAIGIPSAILTRLGMPRDSLRLCLTMLSLLVVLCTISILNLVAVSLDRYWAILYPLDYHKRISEKTALLIILACWILGAIIGFLPLFGWNNAHLSQGQCFFIPIINYNFLVFVYFATIVLPALVMAFFYLRIYAVVINQLSLNKVRQLNLSGKDSVWHSRRQTTITEETDIDERMKEEDGYHFNPTKSISSPHQLNRLGLKGEECSAFNFDLTTNTTAGSSQDTLSCSPTSTTYSTRNSFVRHQSNEEYRHHQHHHGHHHHHHHNHHHQKHQLQRDQRDSSNAKRQWKSMVSVKNSVDSDSPSLEYGKKPKSGSFLSSFYRSSSSSFVSANNNNNNNNNHHHNHKLSYNRREVAKAQKLFVIVVFFILCWLPLYTSNTINAFCPQCQQASSTVVDFLIILSHINSAGSPFLYAFHMKDFRGALHRLVCQGAINQRKLRDLRRREEMFTLSGHRARRTTSRQHSGRAMVGNQLAVQRAHHHHHHHDGRKGDRRNSSVACQHCHQHRRPSSHFSSS